MTPTMKVKMPTRMASRMYAMIRFGTSAYTRPDGGAVAAGVPLGLGALGKSALIR
jgi:hypothetical protein